MPAVIAGQENNTEIEIYYEDHGAGPPVVLIHGYPLSGRAWDKQVPVLLQAGHRVITYDRRGFGASSQPAVGYDYDSFAADLDTLLEHLGLHDAVLVGHSMGTGEVTRYLGSYGSARVAKGVLVSPIPPFLLQTSDNPDGVPQSLFDGFAQAARADTPAWMKGFLDTFYNIDTLRGTLVSDQAWQASWNIAVAASATAAVACIGTWATDFRADLPKIDVPMLIVQGDADQVLPIDKTGKRLPGLINDMRLVVIEGGPHAIAWTPCGPGQRRATGLPAHLSPAISGTRLSPFQDKSIVKGVTMSNHFSADNLKSPGDDRRLDLTEVYLFKSSKDPSKLVLIMNSNPTVPDPAPNPDRGPEFYPGAVYRINIDTDGDALADAAFALTFSDYEDGSQTGTAWYATGDQARHPEPDGQRLTASLPVSFDGTVQPVQAGPARLFAGRRSDPFFADLEGTVHNFQWTGQDHFADNNVSTIVVEVPTDLFGTGRQIGVWATISRRRDDGTLEQMDRGGNPTINPFINPDGEKNLFNARQPVDDVNNYLEPWSKVLENGGYPPEEAQAAALQFLPDILRYDLTKPIAYPNGRKPIDDVYSYRFAWLTYGKVPPQGLTPHADLLIDFPYLGPPNP